jgi:hypothetical protein
VDVGQDVASAVVKLAASILRPVADLEHGVEVEAGGAVLVVRDSPVTVAET